MLNERIARGIGPARIDIAYEERGNPEGPPLLLIMGLAAQLVHWPECFVDALVARGLRVIRFDNRDAGHSTHMVQAPPPDFTAAMGGDFSSVSYTLSDMAADAVGLLDALGIAAAHVVGASMGGAIGQHLAIEHPRRVLSLTSMMSTSGDLSVGQMHAEARQALFGGSPVSTREDVIERALRAAPVVRSPAYPTPPEAIAATAGRAWDRDHDGLAIVRQAVASLASGDRTVKLREVAAPTLVIHGTHDVICDVSGGRAVAATIPGAELVLIEGMGHDVPPGLWDRFADHIQNNISKGQQP